MSSLQSQMRRRDAEMVPVVLVRAMFAVMLASLALTTFAVLSGRPLVGIPEPSPIVAEVAVRLVSETDGRVSVLDQEGAVLARSDDDRAGFIAVMQRVIARERMRRDVAESEPVRVVRHADGRVALIDDATGWTVDLAGNGRDNVAAFARLVP